MNLLKKRESTSPFDLMMDFRREMDHLFNRSLLRKTEEGGFFEPEVDVAEEKDRFIVKADIPGIKKEELDIRVEGQVLTLKGERKQEKEAREKNYCTSERFYGSFTRSIVLPAEVKADEVKASCKDGVLEILLPKTQGAKSKEVHVKIQ